jgi:hypothetical protein
LRATGVGVLVGEVTISGTIRVRCPACNLEQEAALVQSINTRQNPELKQRLLAGELNVLACTCGKRTQLAATLLYHDPDRDFFCQACPGGDAAMERGATAFQAIGATGTQRLVSSQNELMEKVKLLDLGLADGVIEVLKVLLLAAIGNPNTHTMILFERVDRADDSIVWVVFDMDARTQRVLSSPFPAYEKVSMTLQVPANELRIDRVWALEAMRTMKSKAN